MVAEAPEMSTPPTFWPLFPLMVQLLICGLPDPTKLMAVPALPVMRQLRMSGLLGGAVSIPSPELPAMMQLRRVGLLEYMITAAEAFELDRKEQFSTRGS